VRTLAFFLVLVAIAVVAASYMLQTQPSDPPRVEPNPRTTSIRQPLAPSEQRSEPASAPVGDAPRTVQPAPQALTDARIALIERVTGERIAAYLQEQGLSEVDSQRIVADGSRQLAECVNQALTESEALTPSPPDSLEQMSAVVAKLSICQENAAQQAGVPLSAVRDALRGAMMTSVPGAEQ
jgi:hypothetical protein